MERELEMINTTSDNTLTTKIFELWNRKEFGSGELNAVERRNSEHLDVTSLVVHA
jgi:hypothetical protein